MHSNVAAAAGTAVASLAVTWVVLAFFSSIVLDVVNAVYVCYALDKDRDAVTRPEVSDRWGSPCHKGCWACHKGCWPHGLDSLRAELNHAPVLGRGGTIHDATRCGGRFHFPSRARPSSLAWSTRSPKRLRCLHRRGAARHLSQWC